MKNPPQGTTSLSLKTSKFEDNKDNCCTKESITRHDKPIAEDKFQHDKDNYHVVEDTGPLPTTQTSRTIVENKQTSKKA
jgi:hypothetical protein